MTGSHQYWAGRGQLGGLSQSSMLTRGNCCSKAVFTEQREVVIILVYTLQRTTTDRTASLYLATCLTHLNTTGYPYLTRLSVFLKFFKGLVVSYVILSRKC